MQNYSWYDDRVTHLNATQTEVSKQDVCFSTPREIYSYLDKFIWKQEEAKKAVSMLMWKTLNGIRSNILLVGPTASGKSEIMKQLSNIFPSKVILTDASNITQDGFKGDKKWSTILSNPSLQTHEQKILVLDELDKALAPRFTSGGENVAHSIMGEGLKILEGTFIDVTRNNTTYQVDTRNISFVGCGAFSLLADSIAEKSKGASIGFGASNNDMRAYSTPITAQDIIDEYSVMPEFLGRFEKIVPFEPMTEEDFARMLSESPNSPIQRLEKQYRLKLHLSNEKKQELARSAYENGFGVRGIIGQLVTLIDDNLFEEPTAKYLEL